MKPGIQKAFRYLTLTFTPLLLSGCVVSIGGRVSSTPPPPPPTVVVTEPGQAATISEIDAAGRMNSDSARVYSLSQIAERPNLAQPVRVHLVNTAYRVLSYDSSKVAVLQKVIERQDFCDATRQAIVTQLNQLGYESSRQTILNQINDKMKVATK